MIVISKTRSTIEPTTELGNSFFEAKNETLLLQSYQRDSITENLHCRKIRSE